MPTLDLTQYEEQNFDALEPGRYFAQIFEIEERETQGGPGAKMPEGTPMIWVHFLITGRVGEDSGPNEESPYYNRRAFTNMVIPTAEYIALDPKNAKKAKTMNGRIVSFFKAVGFSEEEVTTAGFEPDLEDLVERQLGIQLNRKERIDPETKKGTGEYNNNVVGMKPLEEYLGSDASPAGLL